MIPTQEINQLLMPFVSGLIAVVFSLWFKDFAGKIAKGLMFKISRAFNPGDKVVLDNEPAIIVSVGVTYTVFAIYRTEKNSREVDTYWRYVPNERIPYLKLEKIITETRAGEPDAK